MIFRMSILEWNIHCMTRHVDIGDVVFSQINETKEDVNVIIEYKENEEFEKNIEKLGYVICKNSPCYKQNEILVAIKKDIILNNTIPFIITELPIKKDEICPNFIHVHFYERSGKAISIIGVRCLSGDGVDFNSQIKPIVRYLSKLTVDNPNLKIITTGDFNAVNSTLRKTVPKYLKVVSPEHNTRLYNSDDYINNYSYFFTNENTKVINDMKGLDHFICSSNTNITDLMYSWEYIKNNNKIYPEYSEIKKNVTYWNINAGWPDHAILRGVVS